MIGLCWNFTWRVSCIIQKCYHELLRSCIAQARSGTILKPHSMPSQSDTFSYKLSSRFLNTSRHTDEGVFKSFSWLLLMPLNPLKPGRNSIITQHLHNNTFVTKIDQAGRVMLSNCLLQPHNSTFKPQRQQHVQVHTEDLPSQLQEPINTSIYLGLLYSVASWSTLDTKCKMCHRNNFVRNNAAAKSHRVIFFNKCIHQWQSYTFAVLIPSMPISRDIPLAVENMACKCFQDHQKCSIGEHCTNFAFNIPSMFRQIVRVFAVGKVPSRVLTTSGPA